MSKELEAFNKVVEFISEMPLSYKGYNNLGVSEYISDRLNEIEEALNEYVELKKALTPPTAEEVCEALSEYYGVEVLHNTYEHDDINETFMRDAFYRVKIKIDMDGKPYKVKHDIVAGGVDGITLNAWLPPHLITLIGRFYEVQE